MTTNHTPPRWHCPPDGGQAGPPWCDGLPCPGHRATRAVTDAARVLAWGDGHDRLDDLDRAARGDYLTTAVLALADIEAHR